MLTPGNVDASQDSPFLKPVCSRCLADRGLCSSCAQLDKAILPQLAAPSWVRLIQRAHQVKTLKESASAKRIREKKARKQHRRVMRSMLGLSSPVRSVA